MFQLRTHLRSILCLLLIAFLVADASAQTPEGQFMCRRQEPGSGEVGVGFFTNVATMNLRKDGSFQAKDLTTNVPEIRGHFIYDDKKKIIVWDSGIWKTLLGHYVPNVSGTDVVMVTTKKDAQGKRDGALQCVRIGR